MPSHWEECIFLFDSAIWSILVIQLKYVEEAQITPLRSIQECNCWLRVVKSFITVAAQHNKHQTSWRLFQPPATKGWSFRARERCRRNCWVTFEGLSNMEKSWIITHNLVGKVIVRTLKKHFSCNDTLQWTLSLLL